MNTAQWTRENVAWLAGLYEGEGCVVAPPSGGIRAKISMGDRDILERYCTLSGATLTGPHPACGVGTQPYWMATINGRAAYALLAAIFDWLGNRRRAQVTKAIARWATQTQWRKLTGTQVREIRARHADGGCSYKSLAREYNVSFGLIGHIVTGRNRADV